LRFFTEENENALAERRQKWLFGGHSLSKEGALKKRELWAKVPVVVVVKSETDVRVQS